MEGSVFSDITPCNPVFFTCCLLHAGFLLTLTFDLEMKVIYSSEILFDFHHTTWHYIPADGTLHDHHWENFKACIMGIVWVMIFQYRSTQITIKALYVQQSCKLWESGKYRNISYTGLVFMHVYIYFCIFKRFKNKAGKICEFQEILYEN